MIKLIATDMDDTLLDSSRKVSSYSLDIINKVRSIGVKFTICTGRMYDSAKSYVSMLGLTDPIIVYNGAMIVDPVTGKQLYHCPLQNADAMDVLALAEKWGCHSQIYLDDVLYTQEYDEEAEVYRKHTGTAAVATHRPLSQCLSTPTTKIILIMNRELVPKRLAEARRLFAGRLEITVSKPEYLEFMNISVNKGRTLDYLAKSMGIAREEVMAFGDARNDVAMLEYAGCSVAVANAVEEAKRAAKYMCASCDSDGEARFIYEHILAEKNHG